MNFRGICKLIILSDLSPAIIQLYGAYINNLEGELLNLRLLSCIALYEILFDLPQDIGFPGLSGVMKRTERGEKYYCCVPSGAVYESQQKRNFVYVVKEREGILVV